MTNSTQHRINTLLDQGFQQIQDDFALMMACLSEILADFGKAQCKLILPIMHKAGKRRNEG